MDFGVAFLPERDHAEILWGIQRAEEVGFDFVGIIDSPYNWMDVYPYLAKAAEVTSKVHLGPYVTNTLTRHPSVTASAMATINVLSEGRAFLAVGRGDSAVKQLGLRPAPWKQYTRALTDMAAWMRGEEVLVEGAPAPLHLKWANEHVPVISGVFGPRGARVAGRYADMGTTECAELGAVKWFVDEMRGAAKKAGRDHVQFEVSIATCISDDIGKARDACRYEPEMIGNLVWHLLQSYDPDQLPPSLLKGFEYLIDEKAQWDKYDWDKHAVPAEEHKQVVTDDMVDRICLVGSVDSCVEKLKELEKLGVDRFCAYFFEMGRDELDTQLRTFADKIIPHFKSTAAPAAVAS